MTLQLQWQRSSVAAGFRMPSGSVLGAFLAGAWLMYACMLVSGRGAATDLPAQGTVVQAHSRRRRPTTSELKLQEPEPEPEPQAKKEPEPKPELATSDKGEPIEATSDALVSEGPLASAALGVASGAEDGMMGSVHNDFLAAFIRDAVITARNCRRCENYIKAKKGKRKAVLNGKLSGMLRDIKLAPNSVATSLPPAVQLLAFEEWRSDVPVYPSTTKHTLERELGQNEGNPERAVGNLQGMWGSKWRVKWSIPVDVDLKIEYEGRLSTSLATGGSLYISMRNIVVEGQHVWMFIDTTPDGMNAVIVHFDEIPSVTYDLSGELRSSNAAAAQVERALAWTAAQLTGKNEWDHVQAFVREKIVDKLLHEHTGSRAVRYRIGAPREPDLAAEGGQKTDEPPRHYQAGELFRTTTRNVNVVSSSPRTPPSPAQSGDLND